MKLPSFAKINLLLKIAGRRADGFHELCTVYQTVSLKDEIEFRESDELSLSISGIDVPAGADNLIIRAAEELRRAAGVSKGAAISLTKNIPSPGGLGGGSSNAAVTLLALRRLWNANISDDRLLQLAMRLGSDVPLFLMGGTLLGTGRGEVIEPLPDAEIGPMIIVTPDEFVSTKDAFKELNAPALTSESEKRILKICRSAAGGGLAAIANDFEISVFARHPEISRVKTRLIELGAQAAALSGSGASVFGIFDRQETRQAALKALDSEVNWRKFAVAAISREQYREALRQVF